MKITKVGPVTARTATDDILSRMKSVNQWLLVAALLASLAVIPYTYTIIRQTEQAAKPVGELVFELAQNAAVEFLISAVLITVGLRLRRSLGLDLSLLNDWPPTGE